MTGTPLAPQEPVVSCGFVVIDRLRIEKDSLFLEERYGGGALNSALSVARLGATCSLFCPVPRGFEDDLSSALSSCGVKTCFIQPPLWPAIFEIRAGTKLLAKVLEAVADPYPITWTLPKDVFAGRIVLVAPTGQRVQDASTRCFWYECLAAGRRDGATMLYDLGSQGRVAAEREIVLSSLRKGYVDLLFGTVLEFETLGLTPRETLNLIMQSAQNPLGAVCKLGRHGVVFEHPGGSLKIEPSAIVEGQKIVGAGDFLVGATAVALKEGASEVDAIRAAMRSLEKEINGGLPSLPFLLPPLRTYRSSPFGAAEH